MSAVRLPADAVARKPAAAPRSVSLGFSLPLFVTFLLPAILLGQAEPQTDPWEPFRYFEGSWEGNETGVSGIGTGNRQYGFIMDGKYFLAMNTSTFEPQEANPEGEVHKDWAFFSCDTIRNTIVLREFHSEGFVIEYVLESHDREQGRFVFVSEAIENLPAGWRARITLVIRGLDEFDEVFELAAPGEEFEVLLRNSWTRTGIRTEHPPG